MCVLALAAEPAASGHDSAAAVSGATAPPLLSTSLHCATIVSLLCRVSLHPTPSAELDVRAAECSARGRHNATAAGVQFLSGPAPPLARLDVMRCDAMRTLQQWVLANQIEPALTLCTLSRCTAMQCNAHSPRPVAVRSLRHASALAAHRSGRRTGSQTTKHR